MKKTIETGEGIKGTVKGAHGIVAPYVRDKNTCRGIEDDDIQEAMFRNLIHEAKEKSCREGGIPSFDLKEIHKYLKKVDGWDVNSENKKDYYIIKDFKFNNFLESQSFVNKVGEIAEQEGHHPDIWFGWGYAKIKIQTHAINGLHESDFVLAAKIDKII